MNENEMFSIDVQFLHTLKVDLLAGIATKLNAMTPPPPPDAKNVI